MSVAAIDIGSNTVRLLVADGTGIELARDVTVTGLARGVESTGSFGRAAYRSTVSTITGYMSVIEAHGVEVIEAVATSASRDAANGEMLMDDLERILGQRPTIIDGDHEATLAFSGATHELASGMSKLVIDVGGGSTEFAFGIEEPSYTMSINMGSVRLTDRYVDDRPVAASTVEQIRSVCDAAFTAVALPSTPDVAIGVAGTFTNVSAMSMHLDVYDRAAIHRSELSVGSLGELIDRLASMTVGQTAAIPSLDAARARVILAGAIAAERAIVRCGLDSITISEHDLLDGLVAVASAR